MSDLLPAALAVLALVIGPAVIETVLDVIECIRHRGDNR